MKYERDKAFERVVKLEKGKTTGRIEAIIKRHKTSEKLPGSLVNQIDEKTWNVTSSDYQNCYTVEQELDECSYGCALRYDKCNICIHIFCCNCADALINHTICKHIHLVATIEKTKHRWADEHTRDTMTFNNTDSEEVLSALQSDHNSDLIELKHKMMRRLSALTSQVQLCTSIPVLKAIESHLTAACNTSKIRNDKPPGSTFNTSSVVPPNKKVVPQRPFFSTKSKRKHPTIRLAKPTQKEKENIHTLLNEKKLYGQSKSTTVTGTPEDESKECR